LGKRLLKFAVLSNLWFVRQSLKNRKSQWLKPMAQDYPIEPKVRAARYRARSISFGTGSQFSHFLLEIDLRKWTCQTRPVSKRALWRQF
jgi:hypothetical protein